MVLEKVDGSIVVIGLTTSAEEFQNTFDHEKGHLAMHISSALKIKPYGEEYQYLTGEIGQSMFKIAKRFLCDDCRQKLVIEIKEIDKKDQFLQDMPQKCGIFCLYTIN